MLSQNSGSIPQKSCTTRVNAEFTQEDRDNFTTYCDNGGNTIKTQDIGNVLISCGRRIPAFKIRQALKELKIAPEARINVDDFKVLFEIVTSALNCSDIVPIVKKSSLQLNGRNSFASVHGTRQSYNDDDRIAFAEWVNGILAEDEDLTSKLQAMSVFNTTFKHDDCLLK